MCVCAGVCLCVSVLPLHLWLCMGLCRFSCLQCVVYLSGQEITSFSRCGCPVHVGLWVIENPDGCAWASRKKLLLQEWKSKCMLWNGNAAQPCMCTPLSCLYTVPFTPLIFPSLHILRLLPCISSPCHWLMTDSEGARAGIRKSERMIEPIYWLQFLRLDEASR